MDKKQAGLPPRAHAAGRGSSCKPAGVLPCFFSKDLLTISTKRYSVGRELLEAFIIKRAMSRYVQPAPTQF